MPVTLNNTYAAYRKKIKSGDVVVWSHKKWDSFYDIQVQAVRFFTQSEYCHTGTVWVTGGRVLVIEAVVPKIRIFPLSSMESFYHVPIDEKWTDDVESYALSLVGKNYSKWEAIKAFFGLVIPGENDVWQCSETTLSILQKQNHKYHCKSTPSNVVQMLLEHGCGAHFVKTDN